jgi:hypothetical protein
MKVGQWIDAPSEKSKFEVEKMTLKRIPTKNT